MVGTKCGIIPKEQFDKLMKDISENAEKIILTNIHRGNFEYTIPKQARPNDKGKQKTLDGSKTILKGTPYYKLGNVVVSEVVFEDEKDFSKGLLPVLPYRMITILWKSKEVKPQKEKTESEQEGKNGSTILNGFTTEIPKK